MIQMRIGEIAERSNTPASTIRYYERVGVLPKPLRVSGQRVYDSGVLEELKVVKLAQKLSFHIAEIKMLLDAFRSRGNPSDKCRSLAKQKLLELDEMICQAQEMKKILEHGINCHCTSLQECYLEEFE